MNLKDLIAAIHSLFESRIIPTPFKYLILVGVVCLLFSLAGFPIAEYVESLHHLMLEKQPRLYAAIVGMFGGMTLVGLASPFLSRITLNLSVSQVGGRIEYTNTSPMGYKVHVAPEKVKEYKVKYVLNYFSAALSLMILAVIFYKLLAALVV